MTKVTTTFKTKGNKVSQQHIAEKKMVKSRQYVRISRTKAIQRLTEIIDKATNCGPMEARIRARKLLGWN